MKKWSKLAGVSMVFLFLQSASCYAYRDGIHFYVTYILGYWCGLDKYASWDGESEAYSIAWADYTTDHVRETDPGVDPEEWTDFSKIETRRKFHFAVPWYGDTVVRGSTSAYENLNEALAFAGRDAGDPLLLGIGFHSLQDSWAHEGYGPEVGHAWTMAPDYPHNDVDKAMEMAENTWRGLDAWSRKVHGGGCKMAFNDVAPMLRTWSEMVAFGPESLDRAWRKNVESVVGKSVPMDKFAKNQEWLARFLKAAGKL